MRNILDYIEKMKDMYEGPRITVAELTNMNTPDLEQSEFLEPKRIDIFGNVIPAETLEDWDVTFRRPNMNGGIQVGTPTKEVTQFDKRIYETPEGERVSEKSTTFFLNGKWLNVPTIHGGRSFNDDQLRLMIKQGQIQPTSVHGSRNEAEEAAASRSNMMKSHTRGFGQGGRIGFKRGKQAVQLTTDKIIDVAKKNPDWTASNILEYFQKDKTKNYVTRHGSPINRSSIQRNLSAHFDLAAEKAAQVPKGYISSAEVFENLPISKKDYFRVKLAKEGGTLLTQEIDKLLKPQQVGAQQFYFKKPSKSDMKSFNRLADKTGRLNNRIADLMIEFDKAYGKQFVKGNVPKIEDVVKKFDITDTTAGKVTTRLAQWYGGQDFKNPQLQKLQRNKVASNRMFKTIEKSPFGNPYRQGLYEISLQTIDAKLGNKQGTFQKLKDQAKQILKDNNIAVYNPNMGKKAFGFNINEIAGVTGSAKSKAAEFSQFIDIMEGNLNTKALAGFQGKLSTARQIIEKDPSQLSVQSKKINKMAQNLEKKYGVELPRLRDPDATKYFSTKRIKELEAQGLDIVKAAERAGYTIEMPKGAITAKEFTQLDNKKLLKFFKDAGIPCIKGEGGQCDSIIDYQKGYNQIVEEAADGSKKAIQKLGKFTKLMRGATGAAKWTGYGLLAEAGFMVPFAIGDYGAGESWKRILGNATDYGFGPILGQSEQEEFEAALPEGSKAVEGEKVLELGERLTGMGEQKVNPGYGRVGFEEKAPKQRQKVYEDIFDKYEFNLQPFLSDTPFAKDQWHQGMWTQAHEEAAAARAQIEKEKQQRIDERIERGIIADRNWQSQVSYAGGGMVGDKSGPPPESGPMSQGLRSLYNSGKKL